MALLKHRLNLKLHVIVPQETFATSEIIPLSFTQTSITDIPAHDISVQSKSELEIIQTLGHGNGGTVYKVRHKQTASIYALKICRSSDDHQEVDILRTLDSPFIVGFRGFFLESPFGEVAILMEFMDGGSLDQLVKTKGSLCERFIKIIAYDVLMGLNYLHSKKIVHRDIKPSNLLVDNKTRRIKIADFGVSKIISSGSLEDSCRSTCGGTAAYMSPERYDPKTHGFNPFAGDVWSLGLTLIELYIGHYPYSNPGEKVDSISLMWEICMEESPSLPEYASENFRDFVECCLQKDLDKRWSVSQLLSHPFVMGGEM